MASKKPVYQATKAGNPANNSGGNPSKSLPQKPIPGPESTGGPISLRRALAKKSVPSRGRDFPGTVE